MTAVGADFPWRLREFCKDVPDQTLEAFKLYQVELLRFNQRLNLISFNTEANADILHFYDCIKAAQYLSDILADENVVYDLGSGNGFPGVIFSILNPTKKVVFVDSDARKCEFLKYVAARLETKNVEVDNRRIEQINFGKSVAMCRGLASLARTLLLARPLMKKDSTIYSLKGRNWFPEVASLPHQICSTWNTEMAYEYTLPLAQGDRVILKSVKLL